MSPFDAQRFAALAASLDVLPRYLLVAAARIARDGVSADPARFQRAIAEARTPRGAAEGAALLLATPVASFAQDETDRALASLWSVQLSMSA
jgi:hypothetical protein